jgi:hypothetical protein
MKKTILFASVCLLLLTLTAYSAEKSTAITRSEYIKQIAKLLGVDTGFTENTPATEYVEILNEKGFEIDAANLESPIKDEEKSALINTVIRLKLENKEKVLEGTPNKATVDEVVGNVAVLFEGKDNWTPANVGMLLGLGDIVKTGVASYIYLRVGKFGRIAIRENSELALKELSYLPAKNTEKIVLNLTKGETLVDARDIKKNSHFEVQTPTTLAAVRGTVYSVKIVDDGKMTECE